jgi:hypothetical protein
MERKRIASAKGNGAACAADTDATCGGEVIEADEAFGATDRASVVDMAKGSSTPLRHAPRAVIGQS